MAQRKFKHKFETIFGIIDVNGINGFTQCLNELYKYIEEKTERNPDKRLIDSIDLLDIIVATNEELMELQKRNEKELKQDIKNILNSLP